VNAAGQVAGNSMVNERRETHAVVWYTGPDF
jgi:hypothetical protein